MYTTHSHRYLIMNTIELWSKRIFIGLGGLATACTPVAFAESPKPMNQLSAGNVTHCYSLSSTEVARLKPPQPDNVTCTHVFDTRTQTIVVIERKSILSYDIRQKDTTTIMMHGETPMTNPTLPVIDENGNIVLYRFDNPVVTSDMLNHAPVKQQPTAKKDIPIKPNKEQRLALAASYVPVYFPNSVKYWAYEFKKWADANNQPDSFVRLMASITLNESCGDPKAENGVDHGLMQVNDINWGPIPLASRYVPETNTQMGGSILLNYQRLAGGDPYRTALNYVAGPGNAARGNVPEAKKLYAHRVAQFMTVSDMEQLDPDTKTWVKTRLADIGTCRSIYDRLPDTR